MPKTLEKYRLVIGLVLILTTVFSTIFLIWQKKDLDEKNTKNDIAQSTEISNLKKENQDLKQKLAELQNGSDQTGTVLSSTDEITTVSQSTQKKSNSQTTQGDKAQSAKININTANKSTLDKLPGIGPAKAQAIIDYRQTKGNFLKPEDIMKVSGIGQATYDKMKEMITVE